jgi:hypothetical protein
MIIYVNIMNFRSLLVKAIAFARKWESLLPLALAFLAQGGKINKSNAKAAAKFAAATSVETAIASVQLYLIIGVGLICGLVGGIAGFLIGHYWR